MQTQTTQTLGCAYSAYSAWRLPLAPAYKQWKMIHSPDSPALPCPLLLPHNKVFLLNLGLGTPWDSEINNRIAFTIHIALIRIELE